MVNPLLEKIGLDLVFKNYRPVSNLQFVSKLTERSDFKWEHMMANGIYPLSQSAYRQHHSTETTLLRVMNDILLKMNSHYITLLVYWISVQHLTQRAYHLNEIFGENVSTNGTARSVLRERKWECAVSFARKTGCSS